MLRESNVLRYMTNMLMPEPITQAIARAWPLIRQTSRSSLRSIAEIIWTRSPAQLVGADPLRIAALVRDAAVGHGHDPVGHGGDGGVVGDHDDRGAQLAAHGVDRLQHH